MNRSMDGIGNVRLKNSIEIVYENTYKLSGTIPHAVPPYTSAFVFDISTC